MTLMAGSFSEDFRLLDLKCKQFANGQILEEDNTSREYAEQISGMLYSHLTNEPAEPQLGKKDVEQEDDTAHWQGRVIRVS